MPVIHEGDSNAGGTTRHLTALQEILSQYSTLAVAISGGVDSMTLAAVAHDAIGKRVVMVHAVSPAVPPEATARVQHQADASGWRLKVVDAGEFSDQDYRKNPVNRCYFCKSNLYARIRDVWSGQVASGANLDDLGDYRPGLLAAKEMQVVHPLIQAGINKQAVRDIAKLLGLTTVAELPAQPCLSSRIETGIAINADDLIFVNQVEMLLQKRLGAGDIRCRITASGVRIEVAESLRITNDSQWASICKEVSSLVNNSNRTLSGFADYERGSAFLHSSLIQHVVQ